MTAKRLPSASLFLSWPMVPFPERIALSSAKSMLMGPRNKGKTARKSTMMQCTWTTLLAARVVATVVTSRTNSLNSFGLGL